MDFPETNGQSQSSKINGFCFLHVICLKTKVSHRILNNKKNGEKVMILYTSWPQVEGSNLWHFISKWWDIRVIQFFKVLFYMII